MVIYIIKTKTLPDFKNLTFFIIIKKILEKGYRIFNTWIKKY